MIYLKKFTLFILTAIFIWGCKSQQSTALVEAPHIVSPSNESSEVLKQKSNKQQTSIQKVTDSQTVEETAVKEIVPFIKPEINEPRTAKYVDNDTYNLCKKKVFASKYQRLNAIRICKKIQKRPECNSVKNDPIFHYDKISRDPTKGKKILVISLIHGDEVPSGQISFSWIQRLIDLAPRNTWRVIPMANPDGYFKRTRMNANGVDINRNFPTKDWDELALKRWKSVKKSDPRKFPGNASNSQPETQCLVNHIDEFQPDFIISIHTPLGVLDFDGPKNLKLPKFKPLPWISLGNYPGSLGRYMWKERKIPVLTIELNNELAVYNLEKFDRLQDVSGTVAIQAIKKTKSKKSVKQ